MLSRGPLALDTRLRRHIENELNLEPPFAGLELQARDLVRKYPHAQSRPVGPTIAYDCHGLTFASRRTRIWRATEIQKILHDDGYVQVARADVLAGDIAVYFKDGDAEHSGIVVEKGSLIPKLLSKWGDCQEFVHFANDCPYATGDIRYYRMPR
jgi:hypothetical protein